MSKRSNAFEIVGELLLIAYLPVLAATAPEKVSRRTAVLWHVEVVDDRVDGVVGDDGEPPDRVERLRNRVAYSREQKDASLISWDSVRLSLLCSNHSTLAVGKIPPQPDCRKTLSNGNE